MSVVDQEAREMLTVILITRGGETIQISLGTKASHNTDHHHLKAPRFSLSSNKKENMPPKTSW